MWNLLYPLMTSQGTHVPEEYSFPGDTGPQRRVQILLLNFYKAVHTWNLRICNLHLASSVPLLPTCPPQSQVPDCPLHTTCLCLECHSFLCPGASAWHIAPSGISCLCKLRLTLWAYSDILLQVSYVALFMALLERLPQG